MIGEILSWNQTHMFPKNSAKGVYYFEIKAPSLFSPLLLTCSFSGRLESSWKRSRKRVTLFAVLKQSGIEFTALLPQTTY